LNTVIPGEQIDAIAIRKVIDFSRIDSRIDVNGRYLTCRAILANYSGQIRTRKRIRDATEKLARRLIADVTPTKNFELTRNKQGAPVLLVDSEADDWNLSMAHSGEWILVALARDLSIGVDVEVRRPRPRKAGIAGMLGWSADPVDDDDFCSRWTLWEAFAKCSSGSVVSRTNDGFAASCDSRPGKVCRAGPWISFWDGFGNVYFAVAMSGKDLPRTAARDTKAFLTGSG
jgi:hypothetical protein